MNKSKPPLQAAINNGRSKPAVGSAQRGSQVGKRSVWLILLLAPILFVAILFFDLFRPERYKSQNDLGGAVLATHQVFEGQITRYENGIAEFVTTAGGRFMIDPVAEGFRAPEVGSQQRIALIAYRRSADNTYLARIRTMRKIDNYSATAGGQN